MYSSFAREAQREKQAIANGERMTQWYEKSILKQINALRSSNDLFDIVLTTNTDVSVRISAHRLVLAAASPYFRAMFTIGMQESSDSTVQVSDVDAGALRSLVDYAYTGRVHVDKSNVESLFSAAHLLQFTEVVEFCEDVLIELMKPSNCLNLARIAHQYHCLKLGKVADRCVAFNIVELSLNDAEFQSLEADHLARILAMDELVIDSEMQVAELIAKWIKYDEINRLGQVDLLRRSIRLSLMPTDGLENWVSNTGIPLFDGSCCKAANRLDESTSHRAGRPASILAVGGGVDIGNESNHYESRSVERYDPVRDAWDIFPSLNDSRFNAGVVNAFGSLYALGGRDCPCFQCDFKSDHKSVERYEFVQERWVKDVAPMTNGRTGQRYVEYEGKIYAFGSKDDLTAAECYDPNVNAWTAISPLNRDADVIDVKGIFHADGLIYVLGDSTILKYDPVSGCWMQPQAVGSFYKTIILDSVIYKFQSAWSDEESDRKCSISTFDLTSNSWSTFAVVKGRDCFSSQSIMAFEKKFISPTIKHFYGLT
ncbi:kelch-like protein 20 [Oscarella lobularis]|uniref:kelch-like protein 20 n=1 Tax=Oscarella lobularis TaxID=121494 RepID=UPI0033134E31